MSKQIGILTLFYDNMNWGGVLQGYALRNSLLRLFPGSTVDILIYKSSKNIIYPNALMQMRQYSPSEVMVKIADKLFSKLQPSVEEKLATRKKLFKEVMDESITNPTVYSDENLDMAAQKYDCLISGSDQVWNPNVGRAGYFQAMISATNCKKIAYAASIARDNLSASERKIMIPLIEDFNAISVREKTAKELLNKYIVGNRVSEVVDPTFLLEVDDWRKFIRTVKIDNKRYALAFFYSDSLTYRKSIEEYCRKRKIDLKFIPFAKQVYLSTDMKGNCERIFDVGPRELVSLIDHAECIFTDSFHGAAFSIIFNKQFCVFERDKNTKVSKNSRLYDLLKKFGIPERLTKNLNELEKIMNCEINYTDVKRKINLECDKSKKFLIDNLKG